jgi:hypothetical protein
MSFDLKSFAAQVRPSPKRPSPEAFGDSVFDAGSPQYVRPEDLFLDIQARLFDLKAYSTQDLHGIDPSDFRRRWAQNGAAVLALQKVGVVNDVQIADSIMSLLRCSKRKNERYPTLLPMVPALGFYKNIKPNLPNFFNDQLRPALSFADENGFAARIVSLKDKLCNGTHPDDSLKQLSAALLPTPAGRASIQATNVAAPQLTRPLLKDHTITPSRVLPICSSLKDAIDSLIALEATLPRILWIRWVTAALRLWLPLFFLRRCAVTGAAAGAARVVLSSSSVPSASELTATLFGTTGILRGSKGWFNQLAPIIQNYVRARFELSILLELVNLHQRLAVHGIDPAHAAHVNRVRQELDVFAVVPGNVTTPSLPPATGILASKKLSMPADTAADQLPFDDWLKWMVTKRKALDALAKIIGADNTLDLVEKVYAYIRPDYEPLKSGFGKNAYEYVAFALGAPRKVDRDPEFPDEFNLIYRGEGGRRARHVMVLPGPQLLGLLVQLVSQQARVKFQTTAKLSDLLDLFDGLGVDFRSNPEDFEGLKFELLRLGLLQSSADAAEAASLNPTYTL